MFADFFYVYMSLKITSLLFAMFHLMMHGLITFVFVQVILDLVTLCDMLH